MESVLRLSGTHLLFHLIRINGTLLYKVNDNPVNAFHFYELPCKSISKFAEA
ncbi:hypothetical protein QWZ13_13415 [Reinekea marina]|uniref:hypothetical protein n=1 Tax=Reinekea marina TaxID=1310421 RepID=UPI0025B31CA9|nr:hypothetical protein [Reinekea marina]MDN3649913.1 hypothetical protein [Reinekea marina]